MYEEYKLHDIAAYAGYVKDAEELMGCSSGGIATAIARYVILNGGYVAGVTYSDDFSRAEYKIASTLEQIEKFKGSKYVEVSVGDVYKETKSYLESGKTVVFFGLPCIIAALRAFLKKDYDRLIAVELICHGPTRATVHRQYIEYLEKKYNSKLVEFSVKKKLDAWTPGYLYAKFEDGQVFMNKFYNTEYGYAFSVLAKKSCYSCKFRGNNRTGDIMIGDFWGATESDEFWNKNGVSSILVHTEKGLDLLNNIEDIKLFETSFERIVEKNKNILEPRSMRPQTKKFERLLDDHDLFYSVEHSKGLKTRIKAALKRIMAIGR